MDECVCAAEQRALYACTAHPRPHRLAIVVCSAYVCFFSLVPTPACPIDEYDCDGTGYQCIPDDDVCDGTDDCYNGSDEDNCGMYNCALILGLYIIIVSLSLPPSLPSTVSINIGLIVGLSVAGFILLILLPFIICMVVICCCVCAGAGAGAAASRGQRTRLVTHTTAAAPHTTVVTSNTSNMVQA